MDSDFQTCRRIDAVQTLVAACECIPFVDDQHDDHADAERKDRKRVALGAEGHQTQQQPQHRAQRHRRRPRQPETPARLEGQDTHRVRPDAKKARVGQRQLPGVAQQHVHAVGQHRVDHDVHADIEQVARRPEQRHQRGQHEHGHPAPRSQLGRPAPALLVPALPSITFPS